MALGATVFLRNEGPLVVTTVVSRTIDAKHHHWKANDATATVTRAQTTLDDMCAALLFDSGVVQGPHTAITAKSYVAKNHNSVNMNYYPFTGTSKDFPVSFTVLKPGNIAICYCAILSDQNDCKTDIFGRPYWMY